MWLLLVIALAVIFYLKRRTGKELLGYARMLQLAAHPSPMFHLDVDVSGVDAEHFPYRWQTVSSTLDLHIYSAFLDDRRAVKVGQREEGRGGQLLETVRLSTCSVCMIAHGARAELSVKRSHYSVLACLC